jgi:NAD+ diphosphatase
MEDNPITFAGSGLDRASEERRRRGWIDARLEEEATRYLPLWRLQLLVKEGAQRSLAWARRELLDGIEPRPEPILLGVGDDVAHFAIDVSPLDDPAEELGVAGAARFEELRSIALQLPAAESSIAAQARSLVDWHARHRFCPVCGESTRIALGGAMRICKDCQAEHFPRTDPVAIAVVARGDRCLLGRSRGWPPGMFSALAGFVEQGETIEEAVRREVKEESSIEIGAVRYVRSQPWPFPSSLMIGCIAEAESEAIEIDSVEIEAARWFDRATVESALAGSSDELSVPPAMSLAHHLLRAWVAEG